jgi:hypothetical protein
MTFNDITIVPVRTDQKAAYLEFSARIAAIYRDYGWSAPLEWSNWNVSALTVAGRAWPA